MVEKFYNSEQRGIIDSYFARSFYTEVSKLIKEGYQAPFTLTSLVDQYKIFADKLSQEIKDELELIWKHELELHPKCKKEACNQNRIMYSLFCNDHALGFSVPLLEILKNEIAGTATHICRSDFKLERGN